MAPGTNEGNISQQFISYVSAVPPKPIPKNYNPCSCISYIRSKRSDLNDPWGTPKKYAAAHQGYKVPWVGAVGISKEGPVWHTWYVEAIEGSTLTISEGNYIPCRRSERTIEVDSELIVSYF